MRGRQTARRATPVRHFLRRSLALAARGDAKAGRALDRMAHIGVGLAMLANGFSPEILVLVGDVTAAWDRVAPIINDVLNDTVTG